MLRICNTASKQVYAYAKMRSLPKPLFNQLNFYTSKGYGDHTQVQESTETPVPPSWQKKKQVTPTDDTYPDSELERQAQTDNVEGFEAAKEINNEELHDKYPNVFEKDEREADIGKLDLNKSASGAFRSFKAEEKPMKHIHSVDAALKSNRDLNEQNYNVGDEHSVLGKIKDSVDNVVGRVLGDKILTPDSVYAKRAMKERKEHPEKQGHYKPS